MNTNNVNYIDPTFEDVKGYKWTFSVNQQTPFFTDKSQYGLNKFREELSEFTMKEFKTYEDAYQALGLFILTCIYWGAEVQILPDHKFSMNYFHAQMKDGDLHLSETNFRFDLDTIWEE